jgi:hypothetical protein
MAVLTGFSIFQGFSGKLGNQVVFRRRGNKTILSAYPHKTDKKPTEKQLAVQRKFRAASAYAKKVMNDPVLCELYKSRANNGKSVYNIIIADFFNKKETYETNSVVYRCPVLSFL